MSKFSEEFIEQFKDTETVRKQTKQFNEDYRVKFPKEGQRVAKPTKSKLGKRL